jgi:Ca2+-binding RTX toxin-like protein
VLNGQDNDDTLNGGPGDDTLDGGSGSDTAVYGSATGRVVVTLALPGLVQDTRAGGFDTLLGIEHLGGSGFSDTLTGDSAANTLDGEAGNDRLIGGGGSDLLLGDGGNDRLSGGAGIDTLRGGADNDTYDLDDPGDAADTLVESASGGIDIVIAGFDYTLGNHFENLRLRQGDHDGTGNALNNRIIATGGSNTLLGLGGDDTIYGGNAPDTIDGGSGNDRLFGGFGPDVLTGGIGADRFVFEQTLDLGATRGNADLITDFSSAGGDRITLKEVDADTTAADDQDFSFIGTAAFSNTAGELRYYFLNGQTVIEMDTDGDALADLFLKLDGEIALVASNFIGADNASASGGALPMSELFI